MSLHTYSGFDGATLAWTEHGPTDGRPLILLHGLFSNAQTNWIRFGTADTIAAAGYRLILPDFRGHGESRGPAGDFPADTLPMDVEALVAQLGLTDFDLGGYSLGARTTARLLVRGMKPRRAVLSGMGLQGITGATSRMNWFIRMIDGRGSWQRGSAEWTAELFMTQNGIEGDPVKKLLQSQVDVPVEVLPALDCPTLIVCGKDDSDNGSAPELAATLPNATYVEVPGNHMSAVTRPELGRAIADYLTA